MHPYQNIPFSAGRRSCIGRHFAMQELKIVACRVATQISIVNLVLKKAKESNRPEKELTFTWKYSKESLKQSFAPLS